MPKKSPRPARCYLLEMSAKYVSKGLEKGAYKNTVGGEKLPERLLKLIHAELKKCPR